MKVQIITVALCELMAKLSKFTKLFSTKTILGENSCHFVNLLNFAIRSHIQPYSRLKNQSSESFNFVEKSDLNEVFIRILSESHWSLISLYEISGYFFRR